MKMYKKSDLTLTNGLLVSKDGDIILPSISIVDQANRLETMAQQSAYLMTQPEATPMPSLDGFKRVSIKDNDGVKFTATTPLMDQKAAEAMAIMDELDDLATVKQANNMLHEFAALLEFAGNDFVVDCGNELYCFDTPMIGSVLDLTKDDIVNVVASICGMAEDGITKHDVMVNPLTGETHEINQETDSDDVVSSLTKLAQDVHDFCSDIDATMDSTKE